jgi:hypothetical protein
LDDTLDNGAGVDFKGGVRVARSCCRGVPRAASDPLKKRLAVPHPVPERKTAMSTESTRHCTDLATQTAATRIATTVAKQAAAHAGVDIRCVGAKDSLARTLVRSTETETYPYSSFEQGGIRRFERSAFARGPFESGADLPRFRVS